MNLRPLPGRPSSEKKVPGFMAGASGPGRTWSGVVSLLRFQSVLQLDPKGPWFQYNMQVWACWASGFAV